MQKDYYKGRERKLTMAGTYNHLQHFSKYLKFLDETNAKILRALAEYGPRNTSNLAKATNLPVTTVGFRLKKMVESGLLLVTVNPNLPRLGLSKGFFVADAKLGRHDHLLESIKNAGYWTYAVRCYGKMDGYCAYFAFPTRCQNELEDFFKEASSLEIFSRYRFFWTTNSCYVTPNFVWYDFREKVWRLQWKEWIDEILRASEKLPENLRENGSYQIMVDEADLLIIKELEKDAATDIKKLSGILGITPQSAGSRFQKHIIERKLIANYNVDIYSFPLEISDLYGFILDFNDEKALARFVNASEGKPFFVSFAKIIGRNSLIANIHILKGEFPNLVQSLNDLYSAGVVKDFYYVTLDSASYKRQTISYRYFENGKWLYNLEERIKKLNEISRSH
jgi:DNA-binding Lrp family transcriptional regulator